MIHGAVQHGSSIWACPNLRRLETVGISGNEPGPFERSRHETPIIDRHGAGPFGPLCLGGYASCLATTSTLRRRQGHRAHPFVRRVPRPGVHSEQHCRSAIVRPEFRGQRRCGHTRLAADRPGTESHPKPLAVGARRPAAARRPPRLEDADGVARKRGAPARCAVEDLWCERVCVLQPGGVRPPRPSDF